ncbi:MAG: DUF2924 domain-containing protein [Rhodospirillaceae bacterium]
MYKLASLLKTKPPLLWSVPPSKKATTVKQTIEELQAAPLAKLRHTWADRYGKPVPAATSRPLLLKLLAWRIQADAFGGLKPETLKILNEPLSRKLKGQGSDKVQPSALRVGTVLKREWRGVIHEVAVVKDGFRHRGKTYKTSSEVACAITGTRWSGPLFFGLRNAKPKAKSGAAS